MSGGGAPANTTSTTTINQSPWQNPTYQALALGTATNPGPVTNLIRNASQQTAAYNALMASPGGMNAPIGASPERIAAGNAMAGAWNPTNTGAYQNVINPTTGAASVQAIAPKTETPEKQAAAEGGLMGLRNFKKGSVTEAPTPQDLTAAEAARLQHLNDRIGYGQTLSAKDQAQLNSLTSKQQAYQTYQTQQQQTATNTQNLIQQDQARTAYFDPTTGQSTNPYFLQAAQQVQNLNVPEQIGQATQDYNKAVSGLQGMTNYTPQQVQASQASAAQANRGDIRDVAAQQAQVARMRGGPNVQAIQAPLNQMQQPKDVSGQSYLASDIAPTQREQAQQFASQGYDAATMGPVAREQGVTTAAPKSWTDQGTAAQYMSPYMQNVVDIQKRESMRDYGKQLAALNAQAAKSKAYGGSRQAIEQSEAARNQAQRLNDIEAQGLQQAYQSGMGQFQAEQGLGSQVGMANTAQINQLKSQYMQMGMTEAQANQAAQNAAAQFSAGQMQSANQANAQMVNQLKSQYMNMGLTEAQANQAAQNAASQFGAQSAQQAALANQQAGLTTGQANLSAAQQTALANQQTGMTAQQLNQLYGQGGFQTQAANQAAQNQAYNNYVAQQLAAQQANQSMDWNTANLNTMNQQQANIQNAQLAQQAALANQQAGLTANQQNLGAYSQLGSMAQGLGGLGTAQNQIQLNNVGAMGQLANAQQQLGQSYLNNLQTNAQNYLNMPNALNAGALNAINAQPAQGGTGSSTQTYGQASWLGGGKKRGGEVKKKEGLH